MTEARSYRVGTIEDLPPGSIRVVPIGRRDVVVFNLNGEFHALADYCPHMGAPLHLGELTGMTISTGAYTYQWVREGEILRCPWHAWEFDIAAGRSVTAPVRRIRKYPVRVEDGYVIVELTPIGTRSPDDA
jgi:nitrite reductase (NADH) small subunit